MAVPSKCTERVGSEDRPDARCASGVPRIRMLVLDVDGTVLTSDHRISIGTRQSVRELAGRGVRVVLASSRSPAGLRPVMAELGVTGFAVAYQGALLCRLTPIPEVPAKTLEELRIPLGSARMVLRSAHERGLSVGWYAAENWYVGELDGALRRGAEITGETPIVSSLDALDEEPHKVLCIAGEPGLLPGLHGLAGALPEDCIGRFSHHNYLEITRREADKPSALAALGRRLGVSLEEIAAIGDGENDAGMLREVGLGIAMGHAPPAVRKLADWVTESNDRDGIAAAVERLRSEGCV